MQKIILTTNLFKLLPVAISLISGLLIFGISESQGAQSYRINNGVTTTVDEFSVCQAVTNSSGADIFVPTNIAAEWLAFRNNLPAGVTLNGCTTMTDMQEPPNAVYGEGGNIDFQVTWSQTITIGGSPRIELNIGGVTRYATYHAGSGSTSITFRYTVQAGETDADGIAIANNSIDLNSGTVSGPASAAASLDMSSFIDSLAAVTVNTAITPPDQVTGVTLAPTANSTVMGISWAVPADNGTAITNYVVQYRLQGDTLWINLSPNPTTNTAEVTGLVGGSTYEVRVAASNGTLGAYSAVSTAEIFNVLDFSPIVWLDGSDPNGNGTPPANGSKVATWVNKAGTGTNATEGVVANQPTFETNVQNGKGAVRFVDHNRGLEGTFTRANGTDLTIIAVAQFDTGFSDRAIFEFRRGGSRGFFIDRRYASNTNFSPAITKGQFNLYTIEDTGATAVVSENTTSIFSGALTFNTDFTGAGDYVLGDDDTGGNRMVGYIGEFLIFDAQLSAADITKVKDYLKNKWGTP